MREEAEADLRAFEGMGEEAVDPDIIPPIEILRRSLAKIGLDAQIVDEKDSDLVKIDIHASRIAQVGMHMQGFTPEGQDTSWAHFFWFFVPDVRNIQSSRKISFRARPVWGRWWFPFGVPIHMYWEGDDLGLGTVDRLNSDDSLTGRDIEIGQNMKALWGAFRNTRITYFDKLWVIEPGSGSDSPEVPRYIWERLEAIAQHLLR